MKKEDRELIKEVLQNLFETLRNEGDCYACDPDSYLYVTIQQKKAIERFLKESK